MSPSDKKRSLAVTAVKAPSEPEGLREKFLLGMAKRLGKTNLIQKTATVNPKYIYTTSPRVRVPEYDYPVFIVTALYSWILRKVFETIIRTSTRNWGEVAPRFRFKCKKCESEFQEETKECPFCKGTDFTQPDTSQVIKLKRLIKLPSEGRTFWEFVRTSLFYELCVDDFYWSVIYGEDDTGRELHVEHPGFIFPISDEYGIPGSFDYFCPICYNKPEYKNQDLHWDIRQLADEEKIDLEGKKKAFTCPTCGEIMVQTYYVQDISGDIKARFGKNEIVHGSMSRLAPELFGNPKMQPLLKIIQTLDSIDDYHLESRTEGKVGGLLCFPKLDQERVTEILDEVLAERQKLIQTDVQTGELEPQRKTALIFIGLGEETEATPVFVPFIDPKEAERTLEIYQLYMAAVDDIYGVVTSVQIQRSRGGQIVKFVTDVKIETAVEHQRLFADTFNDQALPLFGITDWIWKFNPPEAKDKLRNVEIKHQNTAAAVNAVKAGLSVKWVDDEAVISGEAKGNPDISTRTGLPNEEGGVSPRRQSRQFVHPFEISPETGEEITANLTEQIIEFASRSRFNSQAGKESLRRMIYDGIFGKAKRDGSS